MPAGTFTWVANAVAGWSNVTDWGGANIPGHNTGDTAIINSGTVSYDEPAETILTLNVGGGTLVFNTVATSLLTVTGTTTLSSGTINVAAANATLSAASLTVTGGTLTESTGTLKVTTAAIFSGGNATLSGGTYNGGGSLTVNGA